MKVRIEINPDDAPTLNNLLNYGEAAHQDYGSLVKRIKDQMICQLAVIATDKKGAS